MSDTRKKGYGSPQNGEEVSVNQLGLRVLMRGDRLEV